MNQPLTRDDFDEAQWDALCVARIAYVRGTDKATWWRLMRAYTGKAATTPTGAALTIVIDRYLIDHPSWVRHNDRRQG